MISNLPGVMMKKHTNAKKCVIDNITFDSKEEGKDYTDLKMRQLAGEISELQDHKMFRLVVNGTLVGFYEADFFYCDLNLKRMIVQETKGRMMPGSAFKYKVFCALYPEIIFKFSNDSHYFAGSQIRRTKRGKHRK